MLNNQYNIASVAWLIRALKSDEPLVNLLPLRPCDMMFATETLKHEFACNYDKYGDSYTVPVEEKMVSEMLNCIDIEVKQIKIHSCDLFSSICVTFN